MYRYFTVWKRQLNERAVRFNFFQDMKSSEFAVQSADFLKLPVDAKLIQQLDIQLVELFLEEDPKERCRWFPTIEEAIAEHEREFS